MSKKAIINLMIAGTLLLVVAGLWSVTSYFADLPNRVSQHETIILGQSHLIPGRHAALRVVVRDTKDATPLENAEIEISLQPASGGRAQTVFTGRTDRAGTAAVRFPVPADVDPQQVLVVKTRSDLGSDAIERPVTLTRDFRILLTTDKPLYQPGQVIHIRSLALSAFDQVPAADHELEITIADGKGNKVHRETLSTSQFGVAAVDFQLADQVNTGAYKITATLGNTSSEKTVTVEHYVLPRFSVQFETDRPYYLPGQMVAGTLQTDYFFGKPVAGGEVNLEAYTFDVERVVFAQLSGTTDSTGRFEFDLEIPGYIAGSDLEAGLGRVYLQASVTDLAAHTETSNLSLTVAREVLVIEAIPEGGQFRPGVENILYVLTSYPDGSPAETQLTLDFFDQARSIDAQTGPYGLAEIFFTPDRAFQEFSITARDASGNTALQGFAFEGDSFEETVLLRPEKPIYRIGETMQLTILTSQPQGSVYLDIVRQGQTVDTRSVPVSSGRAEISIDLNPDLYGTLELHAYKILSWGGITRDTRIVVVDNAADLALDLTPDQDSYRPGEEASLDIQVTGLDGQGAQSTVGLAIVDESVFALAEQDPGFAKLYFMLEQELLQPRYDLHGFSVPQLLGGDPFQDDALRSAVEGAAQASLAAASADGISFSLEANSHEDALTRLRERQRDYFTGLSKALYGFLLVLPVGAFTLNARAVKTEKRLGASLILTLALVTYLVLLFLAWPIGQSNRWAQTPLDRLAVLAEHISYNIGPEVPLALGVMGILAFLGLAAFSWRNKETMLGWSLVLIPLFVTGLVALVFAAPRADFSSGGSAIIAWLIAMALWPLAFLLRFSGFALGRRVLPAVAALALAAVLLLATLPAVAVSERALFSSWEGEFVVEEVALMAMEAGNVGMLPLATPAAVEDTKMRSASEAQNATGSEPPRLRQYFPETMLWIPEALTDENGRLQLDFPVADSITTWRMSALASTQDGRLGSATAPLRVFQDFFIDLDLPLALTVGDEVSIPVGVFNYLPEPQVVRLEIDPAPWFELLGEPAVEVNLHPNDITVVYFRVRAVQFGRQPLKVTAWGSQMSDAVQKEVRVYPDGKPIHFSQSDRLLPGQTVNQGVTIPVDAIPGTQSLAVKIYPGVVSQVVEGLDSILRMPFGCFEQTSSTTYPNVLVLAYLQASGLVSPEVQMKAEEYINLGYQRLTTFEVGGSGGFSLFGDPPPDRMLTAYGLQEFSDMSQVHNVDPAFVRRAAEWLLSQQDGDGSWENDRGLVHENTWSSLGDDRLPVTAYVVWSLVDAGFGQETGTQLGLAYLRENQAQAKDPYVVALVANALVSADLSTGDGISPATEAILERLAGLAEWEGNAATWSSEVATFMGSQGQTGSIETTALAALALLRSNRQPELANAALTALIQNKDSFGTWYSTQATVLSLKALIESLHAGAEEVNATVTVRLNGGQTRTLQVTPENFDVVQTVVFDDVNPGRENQVEISVSGDGNLMYQVTAGYYLPWEMLARYPQTGGFNEAASIEVAYDRTQLTVDDTVAVDVTVTLNQEGARAESALIDLGLPPGFSVLTEDLKALVTRFQDVPPDYPFPTIERYELTGRQILIYASNLTAEHPLTFSYRLQAKYPLMAQTPSSSVYDYYNPDISGEVAPQQLVVMP